MWNGFSSDEKQCCEKLDWIPLCEINFQFTHSDHQSGGTLAKYDIRKNG